MRYRALIAGVGLAGLVCGPADAVVVRGAFGLGNFTDSVVTISAFFGGPIPIVYGQVTTRLDLVVGVVDGARDGATLSIGDNPSSFATATTGQSGSSEVVVLQSGAPQTFTGAGGTPGTVELRVTPANNNTAAPSAESFPDPVATPISGAARTVHIATAGAFVDGSMSDGGFALADIDPALAMAKLAPAGSVGTPADAIFGPYAAGFVSTNSLSGLGCSLAPCSLTTDVSFTLSADDAFAMVTRTEVDREAPPGDVAWSYIPGAVTGSFDCGSAGCDFMQILVSIGLTGRDALAAAVRFEITPLEDQPVPAPASLALLAAGVAGLSLRRPARRD